MHPADAATRGVADGERVRVFNDRGSLELTAMLNASLPAGVVAARLDWAKLHPDGDEHQRADQRAADRHWRRSDVLLDAG
jgi:anaerobic selenocysteine-containing dehydrogenase